MAPATPTPMPTSSVVPKRYCTQLQSLLYRLPRELRDQIYEYYLSEEDGYHYDSAVKKFLYQSPSTTPKPLVVRLGLRITCRIANEEMSDEYKHTTLLILNVAEHYSEVLALKTQTSLC